LQVLNLAFEQVDFLGMGALLLPDLVLDLLDDLVLTVLVLLPLLEDPLLESLLLHLVVVLELNDGQLDVALLLF
jgi:hypothetical protein